jgi:putative transposase
MEDHVHVVTRMPSTVAIARLAQHLKGETSNLVRVTFKMDDLFEWQEGYAAFSVSRSHVRRVVTYVENQKQHHAASKLWPEWEETDEEAEPSNRANAHNYNRPQDESPTGTSVPAYYPGA